MFTTQQLYDVFKKKISNQEKADRLNISLEEYDSFKKIIYEVLDEEQDSLDKAIVEKLDKRFTLAFAEEGITPESYSSEYYEDLEKGTMKVTSTVTEEPKSAEEIMRILKIDTKKWKLSQYWNKQKGTKWEISALVSKIDNKQLNFETVLDAITVPAFPRIDQLIKSDKDPACGVISLQDLHFGKGDDRDLELELYQCIPDLISKATANYKLEQIVLVLGGDILNMDTFNDTTTSGTFLHSSGIATKAYLNAFRSCSKIIALLKQACNDLHIVYIPGNHDRLSSFHLLHALSQAFINNEDIFFDVEYSERKVKVYGENMFCFEHGDVAKKTTPLTYAVEFPIEWGTCKYRRLYTGHYHIKRTTVSEDEVHGFTTKILPSLSSTDYWHYHKKFTKSKKAAVLEINDKEKGMVAEYIYTINS
jgi:UDP-2,3-diacylglucosamine pyrophosphatase LpxH